MRHRPTIIVISVHRSLSCLSCLEPRDKTYNKQSHSGQNLSIIRTRQLGRNRLGKVLLLQCSSLWRHRNGLRFLLYVCFLYGRGGGGGLLFGLMGGGSWFLVELMNCEGDDDAGSRFNWKRKFEPGSRSRA